MIIIQFLKVFYTIIFVWMACAAAVLALRRPLPFSYRMFVWLIIILSVMLTAAYILSFHNIENHVLFNVFDPIEFMVIPLFYYYHLVSRPLKNIVRVYLCIFPIFVVVNLIWIQNFHQLATISYVVGAGFTMMLQDRAGNTPEYLAQQAQKFIQAASQRPEIGRVYTLFRANVPQKSITIDKEKVDKLGLNLDQVNSTISTMLGGSFVNNFNQFGRQYKT